MSELEDELASQFNLAGIEYIQEYRFAAQAIGAGAGVRKRLALAGLKDWRFDFLLPELLAPELGWQLAIECEGGGWTKGRHTRGKGFADDLRKYQAALQLGFIVYRVDGQMIKGGAVLDTLDRIAGNKKGRY